MVDSPGVPLIPSRDARLTPEAVSERGFSQVKRGYSETEVRAFLRLVADELASVGARERDLAGRVRSLEERLAAPRPAPSDQDFIAALGEETARILGQARESAHELRTKAEEHARRVVREAQENARELRSSTQQMVETRTREAEDAARSRAKDIVGEARTLRERVLGDLTERRQELERQVTELRGGRGRLVEAYQIVERALVHATRAMAEEPAASVAATSGPGTAGADTTDAAAGETTTGETTTGEPATGEPATGETATGGRVAATGASAEEVAPNEGAEPTSGEDVEPDGGAEAAASGARDVGALFEKLRSGRTEPESDSDAGDAPATSATVAGSEGGDEPSGTDESAAPIEATEVEVPEAPADPDQARLQARDDALAPFADDLSRRAKRALQDEQNDVLDGLRRQRGKIDSTKVLPPTEEQLARWAHVLQPAVDRAYASGAASVAESEKPAAAPGALLSELSDYAVTPLRERLESSLRSIDARTPADTEIAIAQALGARYREWRTQDLDVVLGDALAAAYSRGVYDTAPEGGRLRWISARRGKCPDCDDNALEPTERGAEFPTGQAYPPAHPGCRCLLVVDTDR